MQPELFERIVKNDGDLLLLKECFPEKEIFNNTYKETLLTIKLNSTRQKAYIRGACIGMFAHLNIPAEISAHIGSYLDGLSGLNTAQTCKNALISAKEEQERFDYLIMPEKGAC